MKTIMRHIGLAATLGVALLSFNSTTSYALSSSECSAAFKAAKAAGTDGGVTYKVFRSTKCAAEAGAAAVAPAAPAAKPAAAAAPAADDAACRTAWDNWKAAGTRPKGMRFKAFQADGCKVPAGGAAQAPAAAPAPVAPKAPAAAAPATPAAPAAATDTTKSGKPMSPGMAAFHEREVKCGAEWKQVKGTAAVPAGMKWPQFLSACNKRLKAQGQ